MYIYLPFFRYTVKTLSLRICLLIGTQCVLSFNYLIHNASSVIFSFLKVEQEIKRITKSSTTDQDENNTTGISFPT